MIQLQYRQTTIIGEAPKAWNVYAESRIITKDMRKFALNLNRDAIYFSECRYVDTRNSPELKL